MSRVCVVGLGYVGLPTAVTLASRGHQVIGCDIDPTVLAKLRTGAAHFREPELDMLLAAALATGALRVQAEPDVADYHIIAVPTPLNAARGAELGHVDAALASLAPVLRDGDTLVLESTVPVGTTQRLAATLARLRPDLHRPGQGAGRVHLAHCPERVLPGRMLAEIVANDRIIGGLTLACAQRAAALYASFSTGAALLTDARTAELVKLLENAFRDVNIAFANEAASICARHGIDPWQAIALANRHPRVQVLRPGPGVGGHCIAVDPWFLVEGAPEEARLIRLAREVNDARPAAVAAQVQAAARALGEGAVACLGLSYKPDVDDLRGSPALAVVTQLARAGLQVLVVEPMLSALPPCLASMPQVTLLPLADALAEARVVAILVAHRAFHGLDAAALKDHAVVDTVGLLAAP